MNQFTIFWYVNDNKVSHVNPKFNKMINEAIAKQFGGLVIIRGKNHNFLGMEI